MIIKETSDMRKVNQTEQIIQKCSLKKHLTESQIKKMFETVCCAIQQLKLNDELIQDNLKNYIRTNKEQQIDKESDLNARFQRVNDFIYNFISVKVHHQCGKIEMIQKQIKQDIESLQKEQINSVETRKAQLQAFSTGIDSQIASLKKLIDKQINKVSIKQIQQQLEWKQAVEQTIGTLKIKINQGSCKITEDIDQKIKKLEEETLKDKTELKNIMEQKFKEIITELEKQTVEIQNGFHQKNYLNRKLREQKQKQESLKKKLVEIDGADNWTSFTSKRVLRFRQKGLKELPNSIGQLTNLIQLDIGQNNIQTLPQSLSKLKLRGLDIGGNRRLRRLPNWLFSMHTLQHLSVRGIGLKVLPLYIANLTNLTALEVNQNFLTKLPPNIIKLTKLSYLDISRNQIKKYPPNFQQLTKIRQLYLQGTQIAELPPKNILKQLIRFGFTMKQLPPKNIFKKFSLPQLVEFIQCEKQYITINNFPFADMPKLQKLRIYYWTLITIKQKQKFQKYCTQKKIELSWSDIHQNQCNKQLQEFYFI